MPNKGIYVAIELGSSNARAVAVNKDEDNRLEVLAVATRPSSQFIRRGTVYNIDQTSACIKNLISELEDKIDKKIVKVYTTIGGQSMHTMEFKTNRIFEQETKINNVTKTELSIKASEIILEGLRVVDSIEQEYRVGKAFEINPVGIVTNSIEANFQNIVIRKTFVKNHENAFIQAGIEAADTIAAPKVLGDAILTPEEKNRGCALVDLGAQTTTVCIYKKGILRRVSVIPLGGYDITKDAADVASVDEKEAEELKVKYGDASPLKDKSKEEISVVNLNNGTPMKLSELNNYVRARVEEIALNIKHQIRESKYEKELGEGIILTGGGANLKGIDKAIREYTECDEVKVRLALLAPIANVSQISNGTYNTALSILTMLTTNLNCCEEIYKEPEALIQQPEEETPVVEPEEKQTPVKENESPEVEVTPTPSAEESYEDKLRKAKEAEAKWKKACEVNTIEAYTLYLETTPNAAPKYIEEAKKRIKKLTPKKDGTLKRFGTWIKNTLDKAAGAMEEKEENE